MFSEEKEAMARDPRRGKTGGDAITTYRLTLRHTITGRFKGTGRGRNQGKKAKGEPNKHAEEAIWL